MNAVQTIKNYAILCQITDFSNDTKKPLNSRKNLANTGKTWQRKVRKNYAKSIIHLPRQVTKEVLKPLENQGIFLVSTGIYDTFTTDEVKL